MRILYKLLTAAEWDGFCQEGCFGGSPADIEDGFIHFSYSDQLEETAKKHFRARGNLVLLAVSPLGLEGQLKDEISRGDRLFPHLYGRFCAENVVWFQKVGASGDGAPLPGRIPDQL